MAILNKALKKKGLNLEEAGFLLNTKDAKLIKKMFQAAGRVKKKFTEKDWFFSPLCIFLLLRERLRVLRFSPPKFSLSKKLSLKEIREEVKILENKGHKRLLLEFGEDAVKNPIDYVVDAIKTIYNTKSNKGEIRRVNVNIAATTVENYRKLKAAGIGTYQLFQETYHQETYKNYTMAQRRIIKDSFLPITELLRRALMMSVWGRFLAFMIINLKHWL